MTEFSPEAKDMRNDLKELNVDIVWSRGWKVYEVQEGDTLWDITKEQFWITDDTEIANKIIKISKVNMMNDTIKKDSLSIVDWKLLQQPDGIPWDLIFAWERIVIEIQDKWLSKAVKDSIIREEEEDKNNLPNMDY
jgi:hypothetical protein